MTEQTNAQLQEKIAIVTGGASGIGKATCFALANEGAILVVVDLDQARVDETAQECWNRFPGEKPLALAADVRSEQDMEDMVKRTADRFGRIDLLVHSAGILRAPGSGPKFMYQIDVNEWNAVIDTNLKGTFLCNRAVAAAMITQRGGHIINISSTSGLRGRAYDSVYCASKFGIVGLSEALAEELRQYGIRVNVVMPDAVNTPIWDQNGPVKAPKGALEPERIAEVITHIALLPDDTLVGHTVVFPFITRRRKKEKEE
ncbi:MAG TPA: SDR family oxidoreductase [Thermodesulfobacteriota bacterium]|nr:SDR family oxidoreductase [Deltaproteobacteria bacterium]HNR12294.1 SDR family oxidoreductase [Thermodesulfobacteriota bacterium]HNU70200.1 SDR family oxidoreductase [Thermodesulfobacteriota bacterium]